MGEALRLYYSLKKLSQKSAHSMQSTAYLMQRLIEDIYIYREKGFLAQCVLGFA